MINRSDKFTTPLLLTGLLMTVGSVSLSVYLRFPFWYSPFIIGAWLLFGSLNFINKQRTIFYLVRSRKLFVPVVIYCLGVIFGFLVDVVYGRMINSFWIYPFLPGSLNWIIPVFIYYPIGLLHLYELYCLLRFFVEKFFPSKKAKPISKPGFFLAYPVILIGVIGAVLPMANYVLNQNRFAGELTIIAMVMTIFLADCLDYLLSGNSILHDLLNGRVKVFLTVFLSWLIAFTLNEIPNTYSHEWVYQNIPFTSGTFLGVNVIVATVGWIFLTLIVVRGIDLLRSLTQIFSKT